MTNGGLTYDDTDSDKICGLGYSRTLNPERQQGISVENAAQQGDSNVPAAKELADEQREQQCLFQKVCSAYGLPF